MKLSIQNLTLLRKGCNSEIMLFQDDDLQVVLKAVPENCHKQTKHLLNEYNILNKLTHDNIVEVYRWGRAVTLPQKEGTYCLLVQQHASEGNLLDFIKKHNVSMSARRFVFWQIAKAVQYLHCNFVVHRDIKLQNILVMTRQGTITAKLADFGFASRITQNQSLFSTCKGTRRGYMAPQIHDCRQNPQNKYDAKASDMFALGVVLFALILGRLPFEFALKDDRHYSLIAEDKIEQFKAMHQAAMSKLQGQQDGLSEQFLEFFVSLVRIDPQERLTIEQLFEHAWMKGNKIRPCV